MDDRFVPLLTTTGWNAEWKRSQRTRQRFDDPAIWDARAKSYPVKHGTQQGYVKRFLELAGIAPGESVLDMGCGTGALATPLALEGHPVTACDFSQGMLDVMLADQESLGVDDCKIIRMSWKDDWSDFGVGPNSVDVALASRSIATADLQDSLEKLIGTARRRVCLTLPCGPSPKVDRKLMEAAGIEPRLGSDFLYAFNILAALGYPPEVAYIPSTRREVFESPDDARETYSSMLDSALAGMLDAVQLEEANGNLVKWLDSQLIESEDGWELKEPRIVIWAFLACNV